jgi:hypothetical protein
MATVITFSVLPVTTFVAAMSVVVVRGTSLIMASAIIYWTIMSASVLAMACVATWGVVAALRIFPSMLVAVTMAIRRITSGVRILMRGIFASVGNRATRIAVVRLAGVEVSSIVVASKATTRGVIISMSLPIGRLIVLLTFRTNKLARQVS